MSMRGSTKEDHWHLPWSWLHRLHISNWRNLRPRWLQEQFRQSLSWPRAMIRIILISRLTDSTDTTDFKAFWVTLKYFVDAQLLGGYASHPRSEAALVPQLSQQQYARLTSSQQAELELARRRAQKAAEGKRANATAARWEKRPRPFLGNSHLQILCQNSIPIASKWHKSLACTDLLLDAHLHLSGSRFTRLTAEWIVSGEQSGKLNRELQQIQSVTKTKKMLWTWEQTTQKVMCRQTAI